MQAEESTLSKNVWQKQLQGDPIIWAVVILLGILSVLVVYSSTGALAYKKHDGNTDADAALATASRLKWYAWGS